MQTNPVAGPGKDVLWKQYELFTDLFKYYLKLVLEVNALYYAITGSIVSFYFAKAAEAPRTRWALMLPILMSFALGAVFCWGSTLAHSVQDELQRISVALGLKIYPAAQVLTVLLNVFAGLFILTGLGLIAAFLGALSGQLQ